MTARQPLLAALALVAIVACRDEPLVPDEPAYITGRIASGDSTRFLVAGTPGPGHQEDKAVFSVTRETAIAWRDGQPATVADLRVGRSVSLWITGPVLESYPVQVQARAVVLARDGGASR